MRIKRTTTIKNYDIRVGYNNQEYCYTGEIIINNGNCGIREVGKVQRHDVSWSGTPLTLTQETELYKIVHSRLQTIANQT